MRQTCRIIFTFSTIIKVVFLNDNSQFSEVFVLKIVPIADLVFSVGLKLYIGNTFFALLN